MKNVDPDFSCPYVTIHTDSELCGHGFTFTLGRGSEIGWSFSLYKIIQGHIRGWGEGGGALDPFFGGSGPPCPPPPPAFSFGGGDSQNVNERGKRRACAHTNAVCFIT